MVTTITTLMLNLMTFGQVATTSLDNGNTIDNLEAYNETSTFMSDTKILVDAIKSKKIEVKKTNYKEVANILKIEADEYMMSKGLEYDNDMMLNITCSVRKKYQYVKIIKYMFSPTFDSENVEYGHISAYLKKEFGVPKENKVNATTWEFNNQTISLTKDEGSLNFNIIIESMTEED